MTTANFDFIAAGQRVLDIEQQAITQLHQYLDANFVRACELIMHCKGKVVVTGMGKSGHIANKIAATLASTGSPAFYMHPGEASHGDLGMLRDSDLLLAISNSGETSEILSLLPVVKRIAVPVIAMSKSPQSTLGTYADVHLCVNVPEEACPLGLAPTASTTATLAMGDALAVALLEAKGFTSEDFALSHPGGSLGRKLLLRIADIMHTGDRVPVVTDQDSISNTLLEMTAKGLGMTSIVDAQQQLVGVFTDGDLRRVMDARVALHDTPIAKVMTKGGITVPRDILAAEALHIMEQRNINSLIVVDEQQHPIGALNMLDLLKAGVV